MGEFEANLNIDTAKIKSSIFHTGGATPEQFIINFCAGMNLHHDDGGDLENQAYVKTIVTFAVNTT